MIQDRLPEDAADHRRTSRCCRILLAGGTGQVGRELNRTLRKLGDVVAPGRQPSGATLLTLDLTSRDSIRDCVRAFRPDLIVNAAAYTAVDDAETEPELAQAVNSAAPGIFADEARRLGAALVHYSTDYVFDGTGERPWREGDPTHPLNVYGRTKLEGEHAIRASGAAHLILRVCWVHSPHGTNFVRTMLRMGAVRPALSIVADQFGAPTSARVIANVTGNILAQGLADLRGFLQDLGGTTHLACGGETTWYGFASEIFELARSKGFPLAVRELEAIPTAVYPTPAERPLNSRLDCRLLEQRFGIVAPDWRMALAECLDQLRQDCAVTQPEPLERASISSEARRSQPAGTLASR